MKLCIDYLREIEREKGWTPNRISKELGLSSQRLYQLFNEGGTYNEETAYKVAVILDVNPAEVMAAAHFERAKTPEIKAVWEALVEKISEGFEVLLRLAQPRQMGV
jgi:hypothetical protein